MAFRLTIEAAAGRGKHPVMRDFYIEGFSLKEVYPDSDSLNMEINEEIKLEQARQVAMTEKGDKLPGIILICYAIVLVALWFSLFYYAAEYGRAAIDK